MNNFPIEWEDYIFIEPNETEPTIPVRLLTGPYEGVTLCFGTVKLHEKNEQGDIGVMRFTYKILNPIERRDELDKDSVFKDYIGRVLNSVILEAVNETGKNNSEKSDEESRIFEEDSSFSEE